MFRKTFLILAALVAIAVMATPAVAGGKGRAAKAPKPPKAATCKPVAFVFEGTVASIGLDTISIDVVEANKQAQRFGAAATLKVDATTKVVRDDLRAEFAAVQAGDGVTVKSRACKSIDPATTTLVARHISATSPVVEPTPVEPTP